VGYPGLVGTVPSTISTLTALTRLYVPMRVRIPADASLCERVAARGRFVRCGRMRVRDQILEQERLHRPDTPKHHGAHQASAPVRCAPSCGAPAALGVQTGTLWRRSLGESRFSGNAPSTISALTMLTALYAPTPGRAPADASLCERVAARGRLAPAGRMLHCA
jgi:hypothetical protein